MSSSTSKMAAITPRQTIRGHTKWVNGVVHLPGKRHIVTCSWDSSLRLWDLESGAQIGEDWWDGENTMWSMALSPNGQTIASAGGDYDVRLWDVKTRKVISKWTGHTHVVRALCWSANGERIASGSWDGMARVRDVNSGKTVLTIKTGHTWVYAVMYSPDSSKLATGGDKSIKEDTAVKIWDAETGERLNTLKHDITVCSLAWTSDGKKLISGSYGPIRIFDTATWQQIATLEGHEHYVSAISLSRNNRFLASTSIDKTARLWNLDANLQVGPPLQHEQDLPSVALSSDGKVLITGCGNNNAYIWDVHAILKKAGLEDLLPSIPNVPIRMSLMNNDATRRPPIQARQIPQAFFDGVQNSAQSSATRGTHPRSPAQHPHSTLASLLERFSSLFRHSRFDTDGAIELQQRPTQSIFSRSPPIVEVSAVRDKKPLFVARRPIHDKEKRAQQQQTQSHNQAEVLSSETQPSDASTAGTPPTPGTTALRARPAHSRLVRLLSHLVLFLCCASPQHAGGNVQPTQLQESQSQGHATSPQTQHQQGQSQGQPQAQASSSQTRPATPSTSATPTAIDARTTAARKQPRPLPLRTRFILFLCCASPPYADGR
ncbi:WD40-repeat-containing domain protein [Suillus subalutaceus]|uniref:WD40-repeat-containing domain protein n=1 Tax=Suillus subalutaceus TaxID=48586 RepID=UPI001B85FF96|nr:WD40-repeat-containing domain protein [Suillus subalutaceus]KAG1836758.1 WD40-repeat-containing domain protein [Suillus subalutaceus]